MSKDAISPRVRVCPVVFVYVLRTRASSSAYSCAGALDVTAGQRGGHASVERFRRVGLDLTAASDGAQLHLLAKRRTFSDGANGRAPRSVSVVDVNKPLGTWKC
eukprot:6194473-Pleurochrysis_carterae.AAC.5